MNHAKMPAASPTTTKSADGKPRPAVQILAALGVCAVLATWGVFRWYDSPAQRYRRALAAYERRDFNAVRRELQGWPTGGSFEPHRRFLHGAVLLDRGDASAAIGELVRVLDSSTLRPRAYALLGDAHWQLGQNADAIEALEQALSEDDRLVDAHRQLALCYFEMGATLRATNHLQPVVERHGDDPVAARITGLLHRERGEYAAACDALRTALRNFTQDADQETVRLELADCLRRTGQFDEARTILGGCPESVRCSCLLAACELGLGHHEIARDIAEKVGHEAPDDLAVLLLAVDIAQAMGDDTAALAAGQRLVTAHPLELEARTALERVLRHAGQPAEADTQAALIRELEEKWRRFRELQDVAAASPLDARWSFQLGLLAMGLGRPDRATEWFRLTLQISPEYPGARRELARLRDSLAPSPGPARAIPTAAEKKNNGQPVGRSS